MRAKHEQNRGAFSCFTHHASCFTLRDEAWRPCAVARAEVVIERD
ncbi:MAG TPA: hypothetical protein PK098_10115 [Phycisphaerales bacterium]|nr:hypothetical protein [Phycisphaerales bacterium]